MAMVLMLLGDDFAVMKNPANLAKHQANPKVSPTIAKMMGKFAGPQ
jgi:suppressor of tumorigenicity protein 13